MFAYPTIKFTSSHSLTNVPFLDVMVSLHNGIIETDLFTKPTDKHIQHLLSSSCHPNHTKKAIPFSLALRLFHRSSSTDVKFKLCINELKTYLLARVYNKTFLEEEFLPPGFLLISLAASNICKAGEGWYGQPKYCYKKQYTLFSISFAVVFRLLVLGSLYYGWSDLFSRDPTFTTSRIFVHGFCS